MKKTLGLLFILLFVACKNDSTPINQEDLANLSYQGNKQTNDVTIHELSDPDKLNPITSQGAGSSYIEHSIFMFLLDVDKEKMDVMPWLAKARPTITTLEDGPYVLKMDYEIKEEAVWDNGEPVTAYDVDFTFKACKNPHVDAEHLRPYIDFVAHIEIDPDNPKRFTFYTNRMHYAAEFSSGGILHILPEYIYDKDQMMRNYSLAELSDEDELAKIRDNKDLIAFANEFNGENYQREKGFVSGCGPYTFDNWTTGQRIILKKKDNWWGEAYANEKGFENEPDRLIYEIVNDKVTAVTAMKDEQLDLMRSVEFKDFDELKDSKEFNEKYFMFNEDYLSYTYIGVNMRHPILSDKKVRQALAHCVNVPQIVDLLLYGYGKPIASFVHPSKPHYNDTLEAYTFNLDIAKTLLTEAGWADTDNDGVLDKNINGKITPLKLTIKYNSGNATRERVCLMLKENAKKLGIEIEIVVKEWTVYLDECTNHDFELYVLGWVQEAILDDPKQLFHTDSYNRGSNYPGFGNAYTDQLIETLREEMDTEKRTALFKELQAIVHDEVPYILLYTPDNLIAIHKRFGNATSYIARPGYEERSLVLTAF